MHNSANKVNDVQSVNYSNTETVQVTVIIPCYNQAHFLTEAIESVLAQTYPDIQIVVVDDGSTDNTAQVAARYPCVEYIHQPNRGLAAARNTGLRNSRGRYLAFLDADDRLLPSAVQAGVDQLSSHPEAAFVSGCFRYIRHDGSIKNEFNQEPASADPYLAFLHGNYIGMHATVLYRRSVLKAVGGFNPALPCCEDYDLYLRIARQYPLSRHTGLVAEYRQHEANMSGNHELMLKTVLGVLQSQWEYVKKDPLYRQAYKNGLRFWKAFYSEKLFLEVNRLMSTGETRRAARIVKVWTRYAPRDFGRYAFWQVKDTISKRIKAVLPDPVYRFLLRRRGLDVLPDPGRFQFGDFRRVTPVSREFGAERGLPIDRYYIENFLARHGEDIRGHVLEVGDDAYTRRFGGQQVTFCDVLHIEAGNPKATIVADLAGAEHIPANTFDCIVLTQTLHIIYEVKSAVHTLQRILKPGGVLLATFPGISQISIDEWADSWYWSFTVRAARRLFEDHFPPKNIEIEAHGNVLAAISFLNGLAAQELEQEELDYRDPHYQLLITLRAVKPV